MAKGKRQKLPKNSRKTVAVSAAPPKGLASSSAVWRRASASFALLAKRAASSWHAGLIVGALTLVLSFELLAGPNLQRCPHSQAATTGIAQVLGAARDRAIESYRALRLAYQLQRSASDLEKQEGSAQQQKAEHHAAASASSDRHNI